MDDSAIISLYQRRDEAAITESDRKYGAYCRAISAGLLPLREDREECVSDTCLRAWRSIPPTLPRSLRAFLGRITRNGALSRLEALSAAKRGSGALPLSISELDACIPDRHGTEEAFDAKLLAESVARFIRSLPEAARWLFLSRYGKCMSLEDLAQSSGLSLGAVKSRLHRARLKLRAHLEKEDFSL